MPASFLKIGGELVQDAILQLVEVTQELNQHWWCRVECRQTEDKRIPVENLLGQDLQIATRDQAGAEHVVFDGFVLEASLLYEVFGSYTARLKAVTRSYKLDLTAQEAYYRKKSLTDVAQSLAAADGLTADVRCKDGTKRNYVQWGDPDFRFLVRIADDHQAWIRPTAQGIQICDTFQRGAQVMWRQEDGLFSFDVEGAMAPPAFDGTHSDARQMRSVTHTAVSKPAEHFGSSGPMVAAVEKQSKAILPSGAAFLDSRAATADEYKALLERESVRAAGNRVVGHGISQKEDLKAGDTVEIEGVLDGKGTYGLTKVIHRWTAQGYENEFWCTPWKNYVSPQPPELSEVAGVVTARVVDHNDPRKMGRIQVQYDWQENGPTGWVRATTPHAGQDRGFLFMPEIGDEVVVAFEHGDPERPYVVGYLWNGVDQAPRAEFWGEDVDPNDVKRIVTKSGHRIQFVDKPGKESIVIATPQHLKISLIEKTDETGRSMILLHSDGDIFINAPGGRVHLRSNALSTDVASGPVASSPAAPPSAQPMNTPLAAPPAANVEALPQRPTSDRRAAPAAVNAPVVVTSAKIHAAQAASASVPPASGKTPTDKQVVQIAWSAADAYCGDKPLLRGSTKNYADGEALTLEVAVGKTRFAALSAKVAGNSFGQAWAVKNVLPPKTGGNYGDRLEALATASGKHTPKPLVVHFIPNAKKAHYSSGRAHFDLSAQNYVVKIESTITYVKGWGASVVALGNSAPAGANGVISGLTWSGYRWMKTVGVKNKFWDGESWQDMPAKFKLLDSNNFCVGFYKSGDSYKCQYGGEWPEKLTDWDITTQEHRKKVSDWTENIRTVWSNKFSLKRKGCPSTVAECCRYAISAQVVFSITKSFTSGMLIIANGNIRSNDSLWFIGEPRISMAAHEFGHHMGNPDEYAGAAVDTTLIDDGANAGIDPNSIMGQNLSTVKKRHFRTVAKHFSTIVQAASGKTYQYDVVT